MTGENLPTLVRGPLKYVVETSTPQTEAGKLFSVSVRITNPYEVPVTVGGVETKLPAKFIAVEPGKTPSTRWFPSFARIATFGIEVEFAGETVTATGVGTQPASEVILQPGNSTVRVFTIRTVNAIFFVPSLYNLNIEIEYTMDGQKNHDTVAYQMNIRAPLGAIITGAIVGSIVGYVVRAAMDASAMNSTIRGNGSNQLAGWQHLVSLTASVLMGAMVVVAFARKKEAQPILSIEDFWGGLFIGFLSAYGGNALLGRITADPTASAASSIGPAGP